MDSGSAEVRTAAQKTVTATPIQAVIDPARIEVIGVREPGFISVHDRNVPARRRQQS
jgi:hypothetical protein